MNDSVYVLGNGLSRKNIDPNELKGIVVGCNACYRDFEPDVLCAIDAGMIFEIVEHNWKCHENNLYQCKTFYFTHNSWNPLPAEERSNLMLDENYICETKNKSKEFVVISGFDAEIKKTINYIMWVPEFSVIKNMNYMPEMYLRGTTGVSAVYVTCRDFNPKKVYLLGFDHKVDNYHNIYANTTNYFKSDSFNTGSWKMTHEAWTDELLKIMTEFPEIDFYWVNSSINFQNQKNLHFLDEKEIWQV